MRKYLIYIIPTLLFLAIFSCNVRNRISRKHYTGSAEIGQSDRKKGSFDTLTVGKRLPEMSKSNTPEVEKFYKNRNFQLAWFTPRGKLSSDAEDLIYELNHPDENGLPMDFEWVYDLNEALLLQKKVPRQKTTPELAREIDILLTRSYFDLANKIVSGLINPDQLNVIWQRYENDIDLVSHLEEALSSGTVAQSLEELQPKNEGYGKLLKAYKKFSMMKEKDWPLPGTFETLEYGDTSLNVLKLKNFLAVTGDLDETTEAYMQKTIFDSSLVFAVSRFQSRHGLKIDGVAGKNTLAEMNRPLEYRTNQLMINLDRNRWLPENPGERYLIINIPDYSLKYYEHQNLSQSMKVVVGKLSNYTPVLKDTMTYIVFNPTWNVPYKIASKEFLPKLKNDPSYLDNHNYLLLKGSYRGEVIEPTRVDWSSIQENNFPYFIQQKPGGTNALGRIKFIMPNSHAIYLHDTPSDYLFNQSQRDFSHGCIRLEKPVDLAEAILKNQIPPDSIRSILASEKETTVILDKQVVVHFIYQTAWVGENGELEFRNDVYKFDEKSAELIEEATYQDTN